MNLAAVSISPELPLLPHDELLRSPSDLSPSPLRLEILIPPPSSLVPELLPSESLDLEPVSERCSVPSSSVTPETHLSRPSSSPTPFLDSPSPKPISQGPALL